MRQYLQRCVELTDSESDSAFDLQHEFLIIRQIAKHKQENKKRTYQRKRLGLLLQTS